MLVLNFVFFVIVKDDGEPTGVKVKFKYALDARTEEGITFKCLACDTAEFLNDVESKNISLPSMFA